MVRWCDGALLETDSRPAHAQPAQRWAGSDSAWDRSIIKFVKPFTIFTLTGASKNAETTHHRTIAPFMFSIVRFNAPSHHLCFPLSVVRCLFQRTIAPSHHLCFPLSIKLRPARGLVGWWLEKKENINFLYYIYYIFYI